ncbi:hypothetical protein C8R45DRAFT_1106453 [Mycena sanguinolenta]|nr:hypothetical protein C8R45DRAFT_1106453 [Mycena sanguinolenta]
MAAPSNLSVPNNSGNPPNTWGKGKVREMTPQKEAWEKEEREERERQQVAWEQAVEDAKMPEDLQEEERKEAERKEAKRKAKVKERKWQEKMAKDTLDEVSAQLRAVEMKEMALTAEDLEELENILRGESPDNSDVPDKTNDEGWKEELSRKGTGQEVKKGRDVQKGRKDRKSVESNATGDCVGPSARSVRTMHCKQPEVRVEQLEEEMRTVRQSLMMERCFNGWLAAEFVWQEPENKWPWVYLQSINWLPEGQEYQEDSDEGDKEDKAPVDWKQPEDSSSSKSSEDLWVKSWRKDVVPEAPEGERSVEGEPEGEHLVVEQPDDQMQVDDAPVDGEMGDGEMQVDPPASGSSLAAQLLLSSKRVWRKVVKFSLYANTPKLLPMFYAYAQRYTPTLSPYNYAINFALRLRYYAYAIALHYAYVSLLSPYVPNNLLLVRVAFAFFLPPDPVQIQMTPT